MTLTFETVIQNMSDLRYHGHEPAYLLVETPGQQVITDGGQPIPDPTELTVGELEDAISSIEDTGVLEAVLEAEQDGDDRKTAEEAIQDRLDTVVTEEADEDNFVVDDPTDTADNEESTNDSDDSDTSTSGGTDTGTAVEDDVRMIESLTVLETPGPLPDDVRAVLFGENFDGRVLVE